MEKLIQVYRSDIICYICITLHMYVIDIAVQNMKKRRLHGTEQSTDGETNSLWALNSILHISHYFTLMQWWEAGSKN